MLSISRAIASALGLAHAVAGGDLNAVASVKSDDEIKDLVDALNAMVTKLKEVVSEVISATRNVASGSQEHVTPWDLNIIPPANYAVVDAAW